MRSERAPGGSPVEAPRGSEEETMDLDELRQHDWNAGEDSIAVSRSDVVIRIVYSIVLGLILWLLDTLLWVVVVFQLVFSLITRTLPSARLQRFANAVAAYYYQVLRYLTHNDSVIPFPFSDLPEPLEPTRPAYASDPEADRPV
jgi:hypothetical protein